MELEEAVLEAIKQKLVDTFSKINVSSIVEGKDIVIRINLPEEIMRTQELIKEFPQKNTATRIMGLNNNLDKEAQAAKHDLIGE